MAEAQFIRRLRFALLERVALPLIYPPVGAVVGSWRKVGPDPAQLAELATRPRLIVAIFHGTLAAALAHGRMWAPHGRNWVVMTTPSRDGQFAAAAMLRFGAGSVALRRGARGVEAAADFIERVAAGDVGCILVDGPRGPAGIVKPGVARTIAAAQAELVVAGLAASSGWHLNSWDRTLLPRPFARVHVLLRRVEGTPDAGAIQAALEAINAEAQQAATAGRVAAPAPGRPQR